MDVLACPCLGGGTAVGTASRQQGLYSAGEATGCGVSPAAIASGLVPAGFDRAEGSLCS